MSDEREETVKRRNRYKSYRVVQKQGDAKECSWLLTCQIESGLDCVDRAHNTKSK